jgi:rod shape-determining protein MreC
MLKKKLLIFAVFVFLIFVLLTYQSIRGKGSFADFPAYPLRIIERVTSSFVSEVKNIVHSYILIVGKEEENRNLRDKISKLEQEINTYIEGDSENKRLRRMLQLKSRQPDYIASAEVFARDPTNWFQVMWIDKGAKDGISRDMVAMAPGGPVGKIYQVLDEESNVILLTDVNSSVAVRLQSSRVEGILEGRGDGRCYLKYVPKEVDVSIGERLITSGLDGIYPEGLQIGYVSLVEKQEDEVFQLIEAVPVQDLNTVEEVVILKR